MSSKVRPDINGEMDELQRLSQDLMRDENIDISVDEIIKAFENSNEETLTNDVWEKLENTESNQIEKNDWESVMNVAKTYKKTNPKKLKKVIESGEYNRPLILKLGDRYILVAGNTRLCTAAAMGVNPNVFIGDVSDNIDEASSPAQQAAIAINMKKKGIKPKKEETNEMDASSSGEYSGQAFGKILTKGEIYKLHNANLTEIVDASATGEYDVPLFGKTPRGGRKNPLKIDGPDSIYKNRAVKDKKFPKFGGPEGIYVKIKDKCKKFPYCNQGNTGALEFIKEDVELQEVITEISKKYGLQHSEVENIVLNEISKIFI